MSDTYRVGVSGEFLDRDGGFTFGDIGTADLERAGLEWSVVSADASTTDVALLDGYDALLVLRQRIDEPLLAELPRLRHVARWGAGLDTIDVGACTRAGVVVTSTPDGGRRPVASAALAFLLALTHRLPEKDRAVRRARWDLRGAYQGVGLRDRVVGIVGLGSIGREFARLVAPFGAELVAYSPRADAVAAAEVGVRLVDLGELLDRADAVVLTCALTERTRGLVDAAALARMKPTAYLVNVARGAVCDQRALTAALADGTIAGAGLDVFDPEPLPPGDPLLALDNVVLAPHSAAWTDEIVSGNRSLAVQNLVAVASGGSPAHVVDPDAFDHPRWSG